MKRWMAMCLAIIMVLTMLPGTVFAAVESDSGKLEGTLTIKGTLKEGSRRKEYVCRNRDNVHVKDRRCGL